MKFQSAEYRNFGPLKNAEINLADRGLVLVQGDNRVSSSADSNGSGKSCLLEGIVWCLFGKTIRYELSGEKTGDRMINKYEGKNSVVAISFVDGTQLYTVIRYRKSKKDNPTIAGGFSVPQGTGLLFYVGSKDLTLGSVAETETLINDTIGLDFSSFVQSVYFDGHNIPAFPTLTDREIKAIFEKVLSLESLQKAGDVVRLRKRGLEARITVIDGELSSIRSEISSAAVEIHEAVAKRDNFDEVTALDIKRREEQLEDAKKGLVEETVFENDSLLITKATEESEAELKKFENLDTIAAGADEIMLANQTAVIALEGKLSELELIDSESRVIQPPTEMIERLTQAKTKLSDANDAEKKYLFDASNAESKIGKPCHGCGKKFRASDLQSIIDHAKKHLEEASAAAIAYAGLEEDVQLEIDQWRKDQDDIRGAEIDRTRIRLEKVRKESEITLKRHSDIEKLKDRRNGLLRIVADAPLKLSTIEAKRESNASQRASLSFLQDEIDSLRAKENPYIADIEKWNDRKTLAETKQMGKEMEYTAAKREGRMLEVLEKAYGRTGVKAHILETVTPALNSRANAYAAKLTDGAVEIEFSTFTKNKDGSLAEKFSVDVRNREGADVYLGNSSGERKKIDLAVSLALSDLVSARAAKPVDLWVADEIAESLDGTALERVVDLLDDMAKERGTLLAISHTDMTPWIPNMMTVTKTAIGSTVA
jgi:DNA repair exonuclease SbcCD ATPase subunit